MDTITCISTRHSTRSFQNRTVEPEKIGILLDAARMAPSAGNLQDTKVIIITEEKQRKSIMKACIEQLWVSQAPVIFVLGTDPAKDERMYGERGKTIYMRHNAAAMAQNILLAAHDQGLGACWVGAFDEEMVRRTITMPDGAVPQVIIPIGYAAEEPKPLPKLSVDEISYLHNWGKRMDDPLAHLGYKSHKIAAKVSKGREFLKKLTG